jgi:hypothetical protein
MVLFTNFASWHRNIVPVIPQQPRFKNLNIPRDIIVAFTHLQIENSHKNKIYLKINRVIPLLT